MRTWVWVELPRQPGKENPEWHEMMIPGRPVRNLHSICGIDFDPGDILNVAKDPPIDHRCKRCTVTRIVFIRCT